MSGQKYKIVYCAPAIYSAGGVERVVSVKASFFAENYDYDVTLILTEGYGKGNFFPLSSKVKVINFELDFEELWKASFVKKICLYLIKQRKYKKLLCHELMLIRPNFTISVLRREINFLNSIHDGSFKIGELHVNRSNYRNFNDRDSNCLKKLFARYWMKNLVGHLRDLDRMVVLTESAKLDWPELSNIKLIPDPLPFNVESVSTLTSKRIISIGRYAYEKGNDLLLKAWARVEKAYGEWCLDIYGMGEQQSYSDLVDELGLDRSRCHLNGSLEDVKDAYLNSSIFLLPSRFEGFGLVIVEAMSCGLPVVSFDCENGPRNIINNGVNGFLVPSFDVDEYADKIMRLIQDDKLRQKMGSAARLTSLHYDIHKIASQWQQLFEELDSNP